MRSTTKSIPRSLGVLTAVITAIGLVFGGLALATPAVADTAPVDPNNPATPPTVSADALPTTQIDGVAWAQVVVGNTVYVAGKFTTARPTGAAAGTNTTPRSNLLAYNVTTGALISSFNVPLNAQALAITASPDGSRVYVGGDFTTAGAGNYYRIVAISTATGQVISSFRPIMESQVRALAATNTAVYAGGTFSSVNGTARGFVAKINASDGSLDTGWNASTDAVVDAMAVSPDGTKVYVGGRFKNANGAAHYGLLMTNGTNGSALPFGANSLIRDAGTQAGITALYATADRVYGSGYVFGAGGNLEGIFSADAAGNLQWVEDCHGDTYSVFPLGDAVYGAGHPHYCGNIGGFPQTDPWTYHHTIGFSKATTGTVRPNSEGNYFNFGGQPAPSLLNWFPQYVTGSYTGQGQAAWSLAGNSQYLVAGGEFPYVNGVAQYGLTRYAINSVVKSKVGPNVNTPLTPNAASFAAGQARVSWTATYDQDNVNLNYKLVRDGNTASPVYQTNLVSTFWQRAAMGFADNGLAPGSTHSYRLYVTDPDGNQISRLGNTVTISASNSGGPYANSVTAAGASSYWPLDESSGATGFDHVGFNDLQVQAGVTRGAAGPISGVTASNFSGGSTGWAVTPSSVPGPNTFTAEAWFKTTSTSGGKIIGFGNANVGTSSSYDRHVYMDNAGRIYFGVYPGAVRTVNTTASYNNGQWHQVVASLGSNGMHLYIDGVERASRTDVTTGQSYSGYWRVGGDSLGSWTAQPSSNFFAGGIGQVSLYPTVLSSGTVANQYAAATSAPPPNQLPVASFTATPSGLTASVDGTASSDPDGSIASYAWNFGDGGTATGATASHLYAAGGTYTIGLTVTDNKGGQGSTTRSVTVTAPAGNTLAQDAFTRTISNAWGTADVGGAWTGAGAATAYGVAGGTGQIVDPAGSTKTQTLNGVTATSTDTSVSFTTDGVPTGGGTFVSAIGRLVGSTAYEGRALLQANGAVQLQLLQSGNALQVLTVAGLTYTPGQQLRMRVQVFGTSPTTVRAKIWQAAQAEPAAWQVSVTDSTAALQAAGTIGLRSYLSGTATTTPVTVSFDNYAVIVAQ
ncbi:PKD domain-containing protein [Leifsonia poae]|uniref:PKD domain-containing protein n=1 Tax=Leifsonia poae TaxID=110933 RepID=UPI003D66701D